jgi:ATP-dependent helicase/DNAse subunit B
MPLIRVASLAFVSAVLGFLTFAQFSTPPSRSEEPAEVRLPNGRLQKNEILKADHAKNLDDARDLTKLAEELKVQLEKNTEYVFSIAALKKTEEIEKVARRIRSRLKRY